MSRLADLDETEAFQAMMAFLERYWERGRSDEIATLLGSFTTLQDGKPSDPALAEDWTACVRTVLARREVQPGATTPRIGATEHRYHINLFWSDEDESWIGDVPDLQDCSAHGDTPEEALREVQIAMGAWLESQREHGWPIPEPRYQPAICSARRADASLHRAALAVEGDAMLNAEMAEWERATVGDGLDQRS